ncbi:MAG: cytochrome c [Thiothrix sp.]|uniref:c-type cytochrome n=1 Tax=Thiothrix sp. TaxID=1032 RepID=UPI002621A10A|nr:cytochrome c [Thiothrix sp.]MDD5395458.1 cytochrome c [Thiothrix sp.]
MKNAKLKIGLIAVASLGMMWGGAAVAAEKRCTAGGQKVECPTVTEEEAKKASAAFLKEGDDMEQGKGGSTYGIAPFDYLTGVGKRSNSDTKTFKTDSGYGSAAKGSLKTELWDRVKAPASDGVTDKSVYDQWTNNWSPKFGATLVAGADPNHGKTYYYSYCIACHGWLMHGDGPSASELNPRPRTLTRGEYMQKKTNLELFTVIKGGGEAVSLSSSMPNWGNVLQDQDIWDIIAFIRAMQDVPPPTSVEAYLNPKSTFKPIKGDVDALTAANNKDFKEVQEMIESDMTGRAPGSELVGGGFVEGGNRHKPSDVATKVKH